MNLISIIGCGPGNPDYLTPIARSHLQQADILVGTSHLLQAFAQPHQAQIPFKRDVTPILAEIDSLDRSLKCAVLVSGDPGIFSLSRAILQHFGPDRCLVIPGISSIQCAFAAVGESWHDATILSAHDSQPSQSHSELSGLPKIAILSGNTNHHPWLSALISSLFASHRIILCENLSLPSQRITTLTTTLPPMLASRSIILFIKHHP